MTLRVLLLGFLPWTILHGQSASEWKQRGDVLDRQFKPEAALKCYLQAEKLDPDDAELLVCMARQHVFRMDHLTSATEREAAAALALEYAERAVQANPRLSDAHLSVAICVGKWIETQGSKAKVEGSKRVKAAVDRALQLNPRNELAWHILGRWHQVLAGMNGVMRGIAKIVYGGLPPASFAEAEECFQKALKLNPDRLVNYIELGRTYAMMGRAEDARKFIDQGLAMPESEWGDAKTKQRGRDALSELR